MSTITATTRDGQRIDAICWAQYGHLGGTVEAVLGANPQLGKQPARLPAGLVLTLPPVDRPKRQALRLL